MPNPGLGPPIVVQPDPASLRKISQVSGGRAFTAQGVASPVPGTIVVADAARLVASFDRAATWTTVFSGSPSGGWRDLGFTSSTRGVVVEAGQGTQPGALLTTHDGGHSWVAVPFTS